MKAKAIMIITGITLISTLLPREASALSCGEIEGHYEVAVNAYRQISAAAFLARGNCAAAYGAPYALVHEAAPYGTPAYQGCVAPFESMLVDSYVNAINWNLVRCGGPGKLPRFQ